MTRAPVALPCPARPMPDPTIRYARPEDAEALIAMEAEIFEGDRLSPASFRWLIGRTSAAFRVMAAGGRIAGYSLLLFRAGTGVARLYSIAVAPAWRGKGLAARLMRDGERIARRRGCDRLRLEVREDNDAAIRLYERLGYRRFGGHEDYYDDGTDGLRLERRLDTRGTRSPS